VADSPSVKDIRRRSHEGFDNADVWLFYESFEALKKYARKYHRDETNQIRGDEAVVHSLLGYFERHCDKWNTATKNTEVEETPAREVSGSTGSGSPDSSALNDERKAVGEAYEQLCARLSISQRRVLDLIEKDRLTKKECLTKKDRQEEKKRLLKKRATELRCSEDEVSSAQEAIRQLLREDMIRRAFECADEAFFAKLEARQKQEIEQLKQKFEHRAQMFKGQEEVIERQEEVFARAKQEFERQEEVIERQKQVFELTKKGRTSEEIAAELRCSKGGVSAEKRAICQLLKQDLFRRINENAKNQDVELFYVYIEELKGLVRRNLHGKAKRDHDEMDVVQSAIESLIVNAELAHLSLAGVDEQGHPSLWPMLKAYIKRHCEKRIRHPQERGVKVSLTSDDSGALVIDPDDRGGGPVEDVILRERTEQVLAKMTPRQRQVFDLYLTGLKAEKIAVAVGCSRQMVYVEIDRIRVLFNQACRETS
jgi:RNA polymerase sigma factor (sigma-70 family)